MKKLGAMHIALKGIFLVFFFVFAYLTTKVISRQI